MSGPARLLLSGYYGFGNFGDEAILDVFVSTWRGRRPDDPDRNTVLPRNLNDTGNPFCFLSAAVSL